MPFYDYQCRDCHYEAIDVMAKMDERELPCPVCPYGTMERLWRLGAAIGDECDEVIEHGLCNFDGTPRRYRSKSEKAKVAKERGLTEYVVHQDGDRHVKSWF